MLERVNQLAEKAATNVSRRRFLARLGQGAAIASAFLGSMVLTGRSASAGKKKGQLYVCIYDDGQTICDYQCKGTITYRDRLLRHRVQTSLVSRTPVDACPT